MTDLAALPEKLLMERILHGNSAWAERSRLELSLIAASGFLLLLGAGFLIFAMHLWFQKTYPPETAAAFTGVALLAVALVTLLVSLRIVRWRRDRLKELKQEVHDTLQSTFQFLEDELEEPVQNNPITAVVLASLAGYVAGEKYL
jgi:Na+/melibiose symporter-like transporter